MDASRVVETLGLIGAHSGSLGTGVKGAHVLTAGWNGGINQAPRAEGSAARGTAERSVSEGMRRN